uniref:Cysteine-rich secretory protein family n=1 Tax=Musca domestica TaxID=7370 RepID=T1PA51_MUSDO
MLKMKNINANLLLQLCVLAISLNTAFACHGTLLAAGITEEEKEIILREHNRLRQTVATGRYPGQPAAENMREIVWDDELADRAQKWAENCQFRHDPFRTINRFTMGQNLAIIWSTAPLDPDDGDFPSRIQNWFNEVQKYSFGDAWSPKTGHYSQLVWGETSLVGCGFAEYKDKSKYNKLYVCNYGPGGNVVGYNPYEAGKPSCSLYGMKPSKRYNGLCAAPDPSTVSDNAIETYEYKNTNSNNNNFNSFSAYNTKQTTQYSATTKFSNNNNKNSNSNNNNNNNSFKHTTTYSNTFKHQQATSTKSTSTTSQKGGSSFGTKNYGGSQAFTTETAQQQQQQQHQQKQQQQLQQHINPPRMILGAGNPQHLHQQQPQQMPPNPEVGSPQMLPPHLRNQQLAGLKWPPGFIGGPAATAHPSMMNAAMNKPMGRPILKGPVSQVLQHPQNQLNPQIPNHLNDSQNAQNPANVGQMQQFPQQQQQQSHPPPQAMLGGHPFPAHFLQNQSPQNNHQQQQQHHLFQQQQRSLELQRQQHQMFQQHPFLDMAVAAAVAQQQQPQLSHHQQPPSTNNDNNSATNLNYQADGRLSPTSNVLAQWFSPEVLAKASAGKLPLLNMNQALSLEALEKSIQHSSTPVHN